MYSLYHSYRKVQHSYAVPMGMMLLDGGITYGAAMLAPKVGIDMAYGAETLRLLPTLLALSWMLWGLFMSLYEFESLNSYKKILTHSLTVSVFHVITLTLMIGAQSPVIGSLLTLMLFTAGGIVATRCLLLLVYRAFMKLPFHQRPCVIIGCNERGTRLFKSFQRQRDLPQKFYGFFDDTPPTDPSLKPYYRGTIDQIEAYCLEYGVAEVYYALPNDRLQQRRLRNFAEQNFIFFGMVPEIAEDMDTEKARLDTHVLDDGRIAVISYRTNPLRHLLNAQVKRVFDFLFASVVLAILGVTLFPLIALAIRLDSPGPIFFKQMRAGRNFKPFPCYKFRTMRVNAEAHKKMATKNDARITRVGAFLRRTSLDELPQFINVVRGEMSVVGPRPLMMSQAEDFTHSLSEFKSRHVVSTGITGMAQVSGYRGEVNDLEHLQKRTAFDLWYAENWSLMLDLQIIGRTIQNVIRGDKKAY
ncbi:MAG: exopolysaccharide biosynthesis polyprenyl glycosylphosphotransferase [Catalinimonas sp.]